MPNNKKIGFYSGTFDPVHAGHIKFALSAIEKYGLSEVYFLPERQPRHKITTHFAHRLAMIKLAIKPYRKLKVLDLPDRQFSVNKTLPELKSRSGDSDIYFLHGSDDIKRIPIWPNYDKLLNSASFIVAIRSKDKEEDIINLTKDWPCHIEIMKTDFKDLSSGKIREKLMDNKEPKGLLPSTKNYIKKNWLYISLDNV